MTQHLEFQAAAQKRGYTVGLSQGVVWDIAVSGSAYTSIARAGVSLNVRIADHDCGIARGRSYHIYLVSPSAAQIEAALDTADALVTAAIDARAARRAAELARQDAALRKGNLHLAIDIEMQLRGLRGRDHRAAVTREMEERYAGL